mgnify:CR=1 FL=1
MIFHKTKKSTQFELIFIFKVRIVRTDSSLVRVVKLFQTFTHKLENFIVLYQFLIIFYQRIEKVAIIFMLPLIIIF